MHTRMYTVSRDLITRITTACNNIMCVYNAYSSRAVQWIETSDGIIYGQEYENERRKRTIITTRKTRLWPRRDFLEHWIAEPMIYNNDMRVKITVLKSERHRRVRLAGARIRGLDRKGNKARISVF